MKVKQVSGFSKNHTHYCKGIAIILMIVHHLFWNVPNIGFKIKGIAISQSIGIIGKVCVSIFLILSGLGLSCNYKDDFNKNSFYRKRILKLYLNYWFIVISSILILMVFFKSHFEMIIGYNFKGLLKLILTFTGLQFIIGYQGINPAWWFTSVIILSYLCFPLIMKYLERYRIKFVLISFLLSFIDIVPSSNIKIFSILGWIFPFIIGCYIGKFRLLDKINIYIYENNKKQILIIMLLTSLIIRANLPSTGILGIKFDYFLGLLIIVTVYVFWENLKLSKGIICYLGKKSMDIYYVHMFISVYLFSNFIYSLRTPILMMVIVLILSLIWSYILDLIRYIIKKLNIYINKIYS